MIEITLKIDSLGAGGDGVATSPEGVPVYVPLALPGETVQVERGAERTRLTRIVEPSAQRIKPVCSHFAQCGGCSLQHLKPKAYHEWKREHLRQTLGARGLDCEVRPLVANEPGTRWRATLSATRTKKSVLLGYFRRASHELIDIQQCPVLRREIVDALPALRKLVRPLLSRKNVARLSILVTKGGLDISIDEVEPVEEADMRLQLVELCAPIRLARLTVAGELVIEKDRATIAFDGLPAISPPGGFLQASEVMQDKMIKHVMALLADLKRGKALDLYSGMGTFTLPLARRFKLLAVEYDVAALKALQQATGFSQGLKTIETLERDLALMPLSALELKGYDIVLFDPPRSGARAQVAELAKSVVPRLIAISCSPASFARDARILIDGGYELKSLTPFDQFLYSTHVELVGEFVKK
ncbi:MAG: class I SAM-dependent RNA methyltransferase [Hyphomicrobiaceae bacterium]|nr:class I SAM-dependent RNA methyltransferase [Hyphomicrobiaceae bacterium]